MDKLKLKAVGVLGTLILVGNIFLFAFRIITPLMFWMVIIVMAALAYWAVPKWKKIIPS